MPVEAQTVEYTYVGDGTSVSFPFPSKFLSTADIIVGLDGQSQSTGFTVTGAGAEAGGAVVFTTAPAAGVRVSLLRAPPASQLVDFVNGQTVLEGILDTGLDKLTMIVQYLLRGLNRSVRLNDLDPPAETALPALADRKNKLLAFDNDGNMTAVVNVNGVAAAELATQAEALAGTNNSKIMTPLRVAQKLAAETSGSVWVPDLTATGVAGNPADVPLSTPLKGAILLEYMYPGLTYGVGVSAAQRAANTTILNRALLDSGQKRRPLIGRAGEVLEIDYIDLMQNDVEFDLNQMTLRHGPTTHTTMLFVHGASGASRIRNFRMYNGVIDGNAQAKVPGAGYYPFSAMFHSNMRLEDLTFVDPWSTAWIVSDPYPTVGGYPALTSDNLTIRNVKVVRTAANIAKIATNPSMMQGDQAVVTGVYDARLEGVRSYYSGRSGLSYGLNDGGYVKDFQSNLCWCPLYLESLSNCRISGFDIRDWMPFDGNAGASVDGHGIWLTDGDQSAPGLGLPTGRNLIIEDGIITSFSVTGAGSKSFHGLHVSGRNGADHAIGLQIANVTVLGMARSGGPGSAIGLSFDGQLTAVRASNIITRQCDVGYAADRPYTAPGGSAVNSQTDTWVDGMSSSACGYAVYATAGGGAFTRSGVRNSTFGGAATAFAAGLANINNT